MKEIWDRIIKDLDTVRFRQSESYSPYLEAEVDCIRHQTDGCDVITMNTFYRYEDIFGELFKRTDIDKEVRERLVDCMMHLLTRLELRSGIDVQEYAIRKKQYEVSRNVYGEKLGQLFERLSQKKKYLAAHFLVQQERNAESVALFAKALIGIVEDGVVYKSKVRQKELLFYLGKKENKHNKNEIAFAKEAYMPLGYTLRVFFEHSFGIVEDERCLKDGKIEIY